MTANQDPVCLRPDQSEYEKSIGALMAFHATIVGKPAPFSAPARVIPGKHGKPIAQHFAAPKHKAWQGRVIDAFAGLAPPGDLWEGAVWLEMRLYRPKPSSAADDPRRCKNDKSAARAVLPACRPDILKVARTTEDALSGVLFKDDGQVIEERFGERYGPRYVTEVSVYFLDPVHYMEEPQEGSNIGSARVSPEQQALEFEPDEGPEQKREPAPEEEEASEEAGRGDPTDRIGELLETFA